MLIRQTEPPESATRAPEDHRDTTSPGNARRTGVLAAAFFLAIGSHYLIKTACNAMIVTHFGAKGIPQLSMIEAALALGLSLSVVSARSVRVRLSSLVGAIATIAILVLASAPYLLRPPLPQATVVVSLYLCGIVLNTVSMYCVWMLQTSTVVSKQWLYMTAFGAAPQVAMIISTSATRYYLPRMNVEYLPTIGSLGYIGAFALIVYAVARFPCAGGSARLLVSERHVNEAGCLSYPMRDFLDVFRLPYLRLLVAVSVCQAVFSGVSRWKAYLLMDTCPGVKDAAMLLAQFYQYTGVAALIVQLTVVPLAFRLLTPKWGLMLQPLMGAVAAAFITVTESATGLFASLALYASFDYTVNNCMRESLYVPLPLHVKVKTKSVMSMIVPRVSVVVSAGAVIVVSMCRPQIVPWVMGALIAFWSVVVFGIERQYAAVGTAPLTDVAESADEVV